MATAPLRFIDLGLFINEHDLEKFGHFTTIFEGLSSFITWEWHCPNRIWRSLPFII
jgi:hypothetical protein